MVIVYDCYYKKKVHVLSYSLYLELLKEYKEWLCERKDVSEELKEHCNDCEWFVPETVNP